MFPVPTKVTKNQKGFTIIEVLAGIIMATVFVLITSQAIAISALYRVRAQRESEAVNLIQQNLEDIKFRALLNISAGQCDATNPANGYGQALINDINTNPDAALPDNNNDGDGNPNTANIPLLNKSYSLTRTLGVYDFEPYNLMTVSYSVSDLETGNVIADLNTEVIPDAAFECD